MYYYAMAVISVISWPFTRLVFLKELTERKIATVLDMIPHWIKPDHFCYARMALAVPVNCFIFWWPIYDLALLLYLLACVTDFFDGALARRRNECTKYGAALDPVADKVLNGSIFFCYVLTRTLGMSILRQTLIVVLIIDLITFALAATFIFVKKGDIKANDYGKLKFGFQCVGIFFLMVQSSVLAFVTLSIGAGLGIMSMLGHLGFLGKK